MLKNNRNKILGLAAVALLVGLVAAFSVPAPAVKDLAGRPLPQNRIVTEKLYIKTDKGEKFVFDVEIARNPNELAYGLMNRTSMPPDHGMLFVFPEEAERSFWMKNTLIPLDMIFIRADGTINSIHHSAIPLDLTPIYSKGPALAVLELNGGRAKDLGLAPGQVVIHKTFRR